MRFQSPHNRFRLPAVDHFVFFCGKTPTCRAMAEGLLIDTNALKSSTGKWVPQEHPVDRSHAASTHCAMMAPWTQICSLPSMPRLKPGPRRRSAGWQSSGLAWTGFSRRTSSRQHATKNWLPPFEMVP